MLRKFGAQLSPYQFNFLPLRPILFFLIHERLTRNQMAMDDGDKNSIDNLQ